MNQTKNEVADAQTKREQWRLNAKITDRAEKEFGRMDRMSLMMDLESVPDLDRQALLDAPWQDFAHDISGIIQYMDRSTYPGKLTQCFVPRCSKRQ